MVVLVYIGALLMPSSHPKHFVQSEKQSDDFFGINREAPHVNEYGVEMLQHTLNLYIFKAGIKLRA